MRKHNRRWASRLTVLLTGLTVILFACTAEEVPDRAADPETSASTRNTDRDPSPTATGTSTEVDEASVDAVLEETLGDAVGGNYYPGMLILLRTDDVTRVLSEGVANQKTGEPLTARHRFRAAAVTQQVVAAVALQLVQEGELRLDERVETYLPGLLDNGAEVTVEQLLNHSSGLSNFAEAPNFWRLVNTTPADPAELVELANDLGPAFEPGSDAAYSPTDVFVLGLIIEEVTGQTLEEALDDRIFGPLAMTDSSLGWSARSKAPVLHGYAESKDVTRTNEVSWSWAAGGVVSTAHDISRFYRALLGGEVVSPKLLERMTAPSTEEVFPSWDYGLGLAHKKLRCGRAYGDAGALPGYFNEAWTLENRDREVVVVVNTFDDQTSTGDARRAVEQALCP